MFSSKSSIYPLLAGLNIIGYVWIVAALSLDKKANFIVCPIKKLSGYACPSCGSTRSVLQLIEGNLIEAIYINPFGLIIFLFLILSPIWLFYDFLLKKETLSKFYAKSEVFIRKRKVAIPLIIAVIANWIWTISKGL